MTFTTVKMEVSKTNKATGKREPLGFVDIFVPTLADAGIKDAVQAVDEKKAPLFDDDGLPVYTADEHNWLQNSILAQVKSQARNRIVPQSLSLKDGAKIATNWEELTAESTGAGNPAALIANRELKGLFGAWVASLGKSAQAQTLITTLFGNRDALRSQDATTKDKMAAYVADFATTLSAEALTKYEKGIQTVLDICETTAEAEDF